MKKSQWAMVLMAGSIFLTGCAGRGYRTSAPSRSAHLYSPDQSTVAPQQEYDIGKPQLAEPMPMDSGYENAVPTVPAPPALGVSHVKQVGLSRILFGPTKDCGEAGCATVKTEGCSTGRRTFGRWCSKLTMKRPVQASCGSQCAETACVTEGCTTRRSCLNGVCTTIKCKTARAWNGLRNACRSPFVRSRSGDYCVPVNEGCGSQQPCAEPLLRQQSSGDVHLTEDPFDSQTPPQRAPLNEQPHAAPAPAPQQLPATSPPEKPVPAVPARPYEDDGDREIAPSAPVPAPPSTPRPFQPNADQSSVEPRVWPRLRSAGVQSQQSAKTISYSVGNNVWR